MEKFEIAPIDICRHWHVNHAEANETIKLKVYNPECHAIVK